VSQTRSFHKSTDLKSGIFIKFPLLIFRTIRPGVPPLLLSAIVYRSQRHPGTSTATPRCFSPNEMARARRIMRSTPNYNALINRRCCGWIVRIDRRMSMLRRRCSITLTIGWLQSRTDETMVPIRFSTNPVCRSLDYGFQHPPTVLTPRHPPYSLDNLSLCGFGKVTDWYACGSIL